MGFFRLLAEPPADDYHVSMNRRPPPPSRRPSSPRVHKRPLAELTAQRPLDAAPDTVRPIEVRAPTFHPFLFRRRLGEFPMHAAPGDWVRLEASNREHLGWGFFNPHAEIAVRTLTNQTELPQTDWWARKLSHAVSLRRELLELDEVTDAYRVVHAEGDGLSGLVVDKFGDVLVVEAFSLGMYQRAEALLDILNPLCGTQHAVLRAAPMSEEHEGFSAEPIGSEQVPPKAVIEEFGTKFKIDFAGGHKTGFYCDQRDNRRQLAQFTAGKSVLDVCSYTGGFAIQAKVLGDAADVTGIELDEAACLLARENARLNQAKVQFVQGDGFPYLRDMQRNGRHYGVVVLDPPKLIRHRDETEEAKQKYFDFNRLAIKLVEPGGIFLTCSCSGMLSAPEFTQLVIAAANAEQRSVQILARAGAAADHPVSGNCPESEYLKTLWLRVE